MATPDPRSQISRQRRARRILYPVVRVGYILLAFTSGLAAALAYKRGDVGEAGWLLLIAVLMAVAGEFSLYVLRRWKERLDELEV